MTDPFSILGLDPKLDLDLRAAEERHRELSRALHPDKHATLPAAQRRMALGRAIEVNEAWRAIKDPIRRAEALFARLGVPHGETSEPKAPPELLMEMMEAREELSEATRKKDLSLIERLEQAMKEREKKTLAALGRALDGALSAPEETRATEAKKHLSLLGELRYLRRFLDEAAAVQEGLLDSHAT